MKRKRKKRIRRPVEAKHLDSLTNNLDEINRLLEIHSQMAGPGQGRKHNVEVLNKSSIVLLVACWEAFLEDMASSAFDLMLKHAIKPATFPTKVLTRASRDLRDSDDERRVWELAGPGWRDVLISHRDEVFRRFLGTFNTPRAERIDPLFDSLLGITKLSRGWTWSGMSAVQAKQKLDRLIDLRGSIAHRVSASRKVYKRDVVDHGKFVTRLALASHQTARLHLKRLLGFHPWHYYLMR